MNAGLQGITKTVQPGEELPLEIASGRFFAVKEASEGTFQISFDDGSYIPWDAGMAYVVEDGADTFSKVMIKNLSDAPITFEFLAGRGRVYDARLTLIAGRSSSIAADGIDGTGIAAPSGGEGLRGWLSGIYDRLKTSGPIGTLLSSLVTYAQSILTGVGTISSQLGLTSVVTLAPTVTASSAYTAGDCIGGKLTLAAAVAVSGGASLLHQIVLTDIANQKPEGTILIFNANPSAATLTDKTVAALSTDGPKVIASIPVVAADWQTVNGKAFADLSNLGRQLKAASGTSLYAAFVTTSTPTFAATTDFQASFRFLPVDS